MSVYTKNRSEDEEKIAERKTMLRHLFPKGMLRDIGCAIGIQHFQNLPSSWISDWDETAYKIALATTDENLQKIFKNFKPYQWKNFYGQYYTYKNGKLLLEGSWNIIQSRLLTLKSSHGKTINQILSLFLEITDGENLENIEGRMKELGYQDNLQQIKDTLDLLEQEGFLKVVYEGQGYKEWAIREELIPPIKEMVAGRINSKRTSIRSEIELGKSALYPPPSEELDIMRDELNLIEQMNKEFDFYLSDLIKTRLDETVVFGRKMSTQSIAEYLKTNFGPVLYFDSFLALSQQYGLADVDIVHHHGKTGFRTGFNLALFGEPGTGKSFSTRDLILGSRKLKLPSHGLPGRNRYTGGITPARFIRMGQAYDGKTFNFIVPEFNDWFKYKGMVEPLKLAMERGQIQYETAREVIGPYRFSSFFSVNYNTSVQGGSYEVTISDPNFEAIEDRVLCRLHRLTKERFMEIAESRRRLAFGEMSLPTEAAKIRDHLTLVYAIETRHNLVRDRFKYKPILLTQEAYSKIEKARRAILESLPGDSVRFSARLEDRAICLAGALALQSYFQTDKDYLTIGEDALDIAVRFYVEEASVRSRGAFSPDKIREQHS